MKIPLIISLFAHFTVFAAIAVHEPVKPAQIGGFTEISIIAKAPTEKSVEQEKPQPLPLPATPPVKKQVIPAPVESTAPLEHIPSVPVESATPLEQILSAPVESTQEHTRTANIENITAIEDTNSLQEQTVYEIPAQLPQELHFPEPAYPVIAKKRKLEGSVRLAIYIDQSGKVTNMEVLSSSGYKILDNAALSIKDKLQYTPATENGVAVNFMLTKTVTFRLKNK